MAISQEVLEQLTAEDMELIVGTETGTNFMNSKLDSARSKAVETFKSGKMLEHIETAKKEATDALRAELEKKYNPQKSPAELKIEELERKLIEREQAENKKAMELLITNEGAKAGIPTDLLGYMSSSIIADTEDKTLENMTNLKVVWDNAMNSSIEQKFKEAGKDKRRTPGGKEDTMKKALKEKDTKKAIRSLLGDI